MFAKNNEIAWQDLASYSKKPANPSAVERNIANLRSQLRLFFGWEENPIQCADGKYRTTFKIYLEKKFVKLLSEDSRPPSPPLQFGSSSPNVRRLVPSTPQSIVSWKH